MKYRIKFIIVLLTLSICLSKGTYAQMAIATGSSMDMAIQNSYEVVDIDVDATIKDQIAEVTVTQTIFNPNNRSMEVEIFFPLPAKGAVQNLILMVDGKEIPGQLLEKSEATRIYEGIVNRKRDPALMEYVGYGLYKTRVFPIGIREKRKISVSYSMVLDRKLDVVTFSYPFGTQKFSAKALQSVNLNARINTTEALKNIYSPSDEIITNRINDHSANVSMHMSHIIPDHDFKMTFSISDNKFGVAVLSYKPKATEDGYFMLLATPSIAEEKAKVLPKTVLFVLDKSGSMAGEKIEQAKKALKFVLSNLNKGDAFNIIVYGNRVENFRDQPALYNDETQKEASTYIDGISAGGGTNINDALTAAMKMVNNDSKPGYVLFLTDGLPTIGEVNEIKISENCKALNTGKARLFSFGVGYDVNARLLDRLSNDNSGTTEYVKPNDDIEVAVGDLYNNISAPVLTDISVQIAGTRLTDTYPKDIPDLFKGKQLVWLGRYNKTGKTNVTIKGKVNGTETAFEVPIELESHNGTSSNAYIEKIWATRKVGFLIDQIDLYGKKPELINDLVTLSKNYGILTPYTAFLAREDVDIHDDRLVYEETERGLDELNIVSGISGNAQRKAKAEYKNTVVMKAPVMETDMEGNKKDVKTVKNIGNSTFYWRNDHWVESSVTASDEKEAIKVKQFSDSYYDLARSGNKEMNIYLTSKEKISFRNNGKIYLIY